MDHKTASMLSNALINSFKISQQFRGYMYYLKRKSEWAADAGEYFYFDMLLKTKTKYNDNKKFYRDTTLAQASYLDEWWDDMVDHVKEIRRKTAEANGGGRLPRQDSDACQKFNRLCNFFDLCSQPRETRETLAEQLFEIEVWDPLNRDDEQEGLVLPIPSKEQQKQVLDKANAQAEMLGFDVEEIIPGFQMAGVRTNLNRSEYPSQYTITLSVSFDFDNIES